MEHKHTPGPWEITSHRPPYSEDNDFPGVGISIPDGECASGVHEDAIEVWGENCEANARLIATAPDLLEALQALVELHADWDAGSTYVPVLFYEKNKAAITEARAAIARATGTQP